MASRIKDWAQWNLHFGKNADLTFWGKIQEHSLRKSSCKLKSLFLCWAEQSYWNTPGAYSLQSKEEFLSRPKFITYFSSLQLAKISLKWSACSSAWLTYICSLMHGKQHKLSFSKRPFNTDVNLLDSWHFHLLVNVLKSLEVRYLLRCRVLALGELQGVWFVYEAGTVTLKDYR